MTTIYVNAAAINNLPKRRAYDYYPTPVTVCDEALTFLPRGFEPECILDPGAGAGAWGKAARKAYPKAFITGVEVRPETTRPAAYNFWIHGDFLMMDKSPAFDLIIGNPPYNRA